MPVNLHVGRPFVFQSIDGRKYEFGIAVYSAMDDAFVAHPYVQAFTEYSTVISGKKLFQWRQLCVGPVGGPFTYLNAWAPIWLDAEYAPQYQQGIMPGFPPIYSDLFDTFEDHPTPETGSGRNIGMGNTGGPTYRSFGDNHGRPIHSTIKVYPGDPSPPVSRTDPPWRRTAKPIKMPPGFPVSRLSPQDEPVPWFVPDAPPTPVMPPPDRSNQTERELQRTWTASPLNMEAWPTPPRYDRRSEIDPLLRRAAA